MLLPKNITDDRVGNKFYYYHTSPTLDAYKHFISGDWRTRKGYYGRGVYGFNTPPRRSDSYGDYCFRFHCLRPHSIFFAEVSIGKTFMAGYSVNMGLGILDDYNVPDSKIDDARNGRYGLRSVLKGSDINSSILKIDDPNAYCFLREYDFDGIAYHSHDGDAMLFWNFAPHLLRIDGVAKAGESTFKDIPIGATQKDVEGIFYGRVSKKTTVSTSAASGTVNSILVSKYASASFIKYVSKYSSNIVQRFSDLIDRLIAGDSISIKDAVFLESWYYRFSPPSRRSVYGSMFTAGDYRTIVLASVIMANATVASSSPVNVSMVRQHCDFGRLNKYLSRYSLSNHYSVSDWQMALSLLDFKPSDVIAIVPFLDSADSAEALACLHGFAKSSAGAVKVMADAFIGYVNSVFSSSFDLVGAYNSLLGTSQPLFLSSTSVTVDKKIDFVSNSGIVFK